ncbi:MAG: MFS transporter [Candidatus Sulfobium sp.]|jgi:MFS family permease
MRQSLERIGANKVVLALSAARMGDAVGNSILFVIIPLYVAKLPAPWFPLPETVRAGLLISLYGLVNALLQPFAGAMVDRFNRRKVFIQGGLCLMGASTFAYVFAGKFTDILVLRILQGMGLALTVTASIAIMAISTDRKTRGGSMGVFSTSRMMGLSAGPLLGGYLYDNFGFNAAFYAGTFFVALAVVLVQLWIREGRVPVHAAVERPAFKVIDRELLSPGIIGAGLAIFIMAAAFSMITPLEKQFNIRLHESAFSFGLAFSAVMFSRLLFQIPLGRLSDHFGRKPLIIAGLILMAPVTGLLGEAATTLQLIALRAVQGIGSAGIAAPAMALAADLSKAGGEGRQMSITTMGFGLGISVGPLLAGVLAVFSWRLPFFIVGLMLLAGVWIVHRYVPETIVRHAGPQEPPAKNS